MNPASRDSANMLHSPEVRPWWKEPYVWMVIAGPLSAVLACIVTAFYIMQGPDAVVSEDSYREGLEIRREVDAAKPLMQPAQTGRNHSATGGKSNEKP
ncbi:FixH family protein [Polaromonas sp.]|uniref:FixH family protein n=1 Tax=Polaromonas sp. TaxID=1869339 RepID=UPI003BACBDF2